MNQAKQPDGTAGDGVSTPCSGGNTDPAKPSGVTRRSWFEWLTYLLGATAAAVFALPFVGYLLGVRKTRVVWVTLGPANSERFPLEQTRVEIFDNPLRQPWDGDAGKTSVFVRNLGEGGEAQFLVLAVNCAHLGCPVEWFPQSGLFMCPCHGGVYYANGEHASGPPPRGLYHCVWRVRDGQLQVQAPHYPTLQDTLTDDQQNA